MLEGLKAAAAGMAAQQRRMDALGDDIANVSTTAYKRQRVAFRDLVYGSEAWGADRGVTTGSGATAAIVGRSFAPGALRTTERPLDVAISGRGFLEVRRADGSVALTRDGALQVDAGGRLVTSAGERLQPAITVPRGVSSDKVSIAADGTVTADGRPLGRLRIVDVGSLDGLQPLGDNLFSAGAASGPLRAAAGARLVSGALEGSNVEMADAMVDMIDSQRSYQLASKAIRMQDEMLGIANGVKR